MPEITISMNKSATPEDWSHISCILQLSEDFIRDNKDKVNWKFISRDQTLSEDFIREFKDKADWDYVSTSQKLSEGFIREFKDKVDWYFISRFQTLSEDFIREFKDRVWWRCISSYQILSDEFIEEFKIDFLRPNIIFTRDIEPLHPCMSGVKKYLKIWDKDQEITWNEFIEKYADKGDIGWLANKLYINFLAGDLENRLESSNNNQLPKLEEMHNKWTK